MAQQGSRCSTNASEQVRLRGADEGCRGPLHHARGGDLAEGKETRSWSPNPLESLLQFCIFPVCCSLRSELAQVVLSGAEDTVPRRDMYRELFILSLKHLPHCWAYAKIELPSYLALSMIEKSKV